MKMRSMLAAAWPPVAFLALALVAWEILVRWLAIAPYLVPSPAAVAREAQRAREQKARRDAAGRRYAASGSMAPIALGLRAELLGAVSLS